MTATPTPYSERTPPLNSIIWNHKYGYGKVTNLQNLTEDDCLLITCTFDSLGGASRDLNRSEIWLPQEWCVGDEVEDAGYGKGIVTKVEEDTLMAITVEYTGLQITYTLYGQSVLHTIPTLYKIANKWLLTASSEAVFNQGGEEEQAKSNYKGQLYLTRYRGKHEA